MRNRGISIKNKKILYIVSIILVSTLSISLLVSAFPGRASSGKDNTDGKHPTEEISPVEGLYISFLGDSITTYKGYSDNANYNATLSNNAVFYPHSYSPNGVELGVTSVRDTYWYKTIQELSLKLCVNNSCDASRVSDTKPEKPNGMERSTELNTILASPDIIVVYMGINDLCNGVDLTTFSSSYATMISNIKTAYPSADVYVCTLLPEKRNTDLNTYRSFNTAIEAIAEEYSCFVVDFYNDTGITADNHGVYRVDGIHPTAEGMDILAECLINAIRENSK